MAKKVFGNLPEEKSKCHGASIVLAAINGLQCRVCKKCRKPVWQELVEG